MKGRAFSIVLFPEGDKSVKTCALEIHDENTNKEGRYVLTNLSKREVEYLIWILADARNNMKYIKEEPRLFYDFEVGKVAAKIGRKLILEKCPPPSL